METVDRVAPTQEEADKVTLVRGLGTLQVLSVSFGLVVCVSTWGAALIGIGSYGFSFLASILVSALLYLGIAMCYAELATTHPTADCLKNWVTRAFGPTSGAAASMVYLLSFMFGVSAEVIFFSHVFNAMVPSLPWQVWAIGVTTIFGLVVNLLGIKKVGQAADYLLYLVVGIGLAAAVCGFLGLSVVDPDWGRLSGFFSSGIGGFLSSFLLAMWLFAGFEVVAPLAEEVKNPQRDLPRGMFGAIGIIGALKIFFTIGVFVMVANAGNLATNEMFVEIGDSWAGSFGVFLMFVFGFSATSATCLANYSSNSRLMMGMARKPNNMLPISFQWLHPRFRTPWVTLFVYWIITNILILAFGGDMTLLLYVSSFVWIVQYLIVIATTIRLRSTEPDTVRPYRLPLGPAKMPVIAVVSFVLTLGFLILSVVPPYGAPDVFYYGAVALGLIIAYGLIWHVIQRFRSGSTPLVQPEVEPSDVL